MRDEPEISRRSHSTARGASCGQPQGVHVTHSRAEARALADRLFLFEKGGLREVPPASLQPESLDFRG